MTNSIAALAPATRKAAGLVAGQRAEVAVADGPGYRSGEHAVIKAQAVVAVEGTVEIDEHRLGWLVTAEGERIALGTPASKIRARRV